MALVLTVALHKPNDMTEVFHGDDKSVYSCVTIPDQVFPSLVKQLIY